MPYIKDNFDKQKYDNYIKATDYKGALNYLTTLYDSSDDLDERYKIKPFISSLRQKIHKDESIVRHATSQDDKEKYYFLDAVENNKSLTGNSYYDKFSKNIALLGSDYTDEVVSRRLGIIPDKIKRKINKQATSLSFKFGNSDVYDYFLNTLGTTEQQLQDLGIDVGQQEGNKVLHVNKANNNLYNILDGIYKAHRYNRNKIFNINSRFGGSNLSGSSNILAGLNNIQNGVLYSSYDRNGEPIKQWSALEDGKFNRTFSDIYGIIDDAKNTSKKLEEEANKNIIASSFRLPWKTAAHAEAAKILRATGDEDGYKKTISRLDSDLENALHGLILSQENVYSTTDPDDPNYHKLSLDEAHKYQQIFRDALRENRVKVAMAMFGDKFGYQLDIAPKADSKGSFFAVPDVSTIHRTLFIENPWPEESMTNAFEQRTDFRAMKELTLMRMYKYPYIFDDGSSLELVDENSAVYKDVDGYKEPVTTNKAINILNEKFITEDGIEYFSKKYRDSQNPIKLKLNEFEDPIDKNIWAFAMKAAEELVPNTESNEYAQKAYDIYQSILSGIKYKGSPGITKDN